MAVHVPTDGPTHVSQQPVERAGQWRMGKPIQKLKQTRRGRGGRRNGNNREQYFSLLGTNANGLKAKKASLENTVNFFNAPSVITIQETKLRQNGIIKLNGYQIFEMHREGLGGGLLTAVKHELEPVLIYQSEEASEVMVVQVKVGDRNIRIFNAYGPQEVDVSPQTKLHFWQSIEKEIISAQDSGCEIIIELDANAKVGSSIILGDPNPQSENGRILVEMLARNNLYLLNSSILCKGLIIRQRLAAGNVEKSILDYIIVSEDLFNQLEEMLVDEERSHVLTKYATTMGIQKKSESDHNILYAKFKLKIQKSKKHERLEVFDFKNLASQKLFFEETENIHHFEEMFSADEDVERNSKVLFQKLNNIFHKCFKKIRITGNKNKKDDTVLYMDMKTTLKIKLRNTDDQHEKRLFENQLKVLENYLSLKCAEKNKKLVEEYVGVLNSPKGSFSQHGLWKLKSKLCQKKIDPPMAKVDSCGQIITSPNLLKDLYLRTYKARLSHRTMQIEYEDIFNLKTELWDILLGDCKLRKSEPWAMPDLEKVLKNLKTNKTRDPVGLINELFKPGTIGGGLQQALLSLLNQTKFSNKLPEVMKLANITSIWKKKNSQLSLANDRGIFVLTVVRMLMDRMLYNEYYPSLEEKMSPSNIGAMKKKNIRNHLFILYGIMNSVINGNADCIDIQIYDVIQCFDALWLEDCMLDMYYATPDGQHNDKLALIYKANEENKVAVKTPVGLTQRESIPTIVMQGGTFGPMQCSNSIDSIGKKCISRQEHLYSYKNLVKVTPLAMVDDLLAVAPCGIDSLAVNVFINTQIEMKKLKFHTPDANGKSKCHVMHIGKKNMSCPDLKVHGTPVGLVTWGT